MVFELQSEIAEHSIARLIRGFEETGHTSETNFRCYNCLQVLVRQARENRFVYVIVEDRLILCEAKALQPDHNVHRGGTHIRW